MNTNYTIRLKRAYAPEEAADGARLLVDGLWPRGMSKVREDLTEWDRQIAPEKTLRTEFHHGTMDFEQFARAYRAKLEDSPAAAEFVEKVRQLLDKGNVTLIFGSKDVDHNNAIVLKQFLEEKLARPK